MTTRCKQCSNYIEFRAQRGCKLSSVRCTCGSEVERLVSKSVEGENPFFPEDTIRPEQGYESAYAPWYWIYFSNDGRKFIKDKKNRKFIELQEEIASASPRNGEKQ